MMPVSFVSIVSAKRQDSKLAARFNRIKGGYKMFARLIMVQLQADKIDEAIRVFEDGVMPAVQRQKGNHGGYFLTDRKTGQIAVIGFWDSEEDIIANEQSGFYQEQVAKVAPFFTAAPVMGVYEVSIQA